MSVSPAGTIAANRRDSLSRHDPVERLATTAAALVRQSEPVRFAVARTEEERAAIFRLRHRVVLERGWARPEDLPDGIERDQWDDEAVLIGGSLAGEVVACARLVLPRPGRRLPVESIFGQSIAPAGKVVHVDRLVVSRHVSDHGHRLLMAMAASCWIEAHAHGCDVWTGIDSRLTTRLYRAIGFDIEVLGPGRRYWAEERFPVRFDTIAAAEAVAAVWERAMNAPIPDRRRPGA